MSALAHLPMYDFPQIRAALDDLWRALARRLREAGVPDVPVALSRSFSHHESWRHPRLLLGQSCGYPALHEFRDMIRIVATPIHDAPGCEGSRHCSFFVVHADSRTREIADLRGTRFALNSWDSNTGMNLPRYAFARLAVGGNFLGEVIETGSHAESLAFVAGRHADAAAIDCVTHALLARHRPDIVAQTRILTRSAPSPALPFVTTRKASEAIIKALREALASVLADPSLSSTREALFLAGAIPAEEEDYRILRDYEEKAGELGYPRLA
jgi:ABC-type phosphate/phosphonate transport system substrate-binding protein